MAESTNQGGGQSGGSDWITAAINAVGSITSSLNFLKATRVSSKAQREVAELNYMTLSESERISYDSGGQKNMVTLIVLSFVLVVILYFVFKK